MQQRHRARLVPRPLLGARLQKRHEGNRVVGFVREAEKCLLVLHTNRCARKFRKGRLREEGQTKRRDQTRGRTWRTLLRAFTLGVTSISAVVVRLLMLPHTAVLES